MDFVFVHIVHINSVHGGLAFGLPLCYNEGGGDTTMSNFILRPGVDVVKLLKKAGYSTYTIAKAKERTGDYILGQSTLTKLRRGGLPSWNELAKLVHLLHVSPVDLISYQTDDGRVFDLTGKLLQRPEPVVTIQHGHPGDAGYDPDDPGEYPHTDEDY